MASVTIHLHSEDGEPTADVFAVDSGESFIHLCISGSLSMIPAGRNHEAVASARALAAALTGAADTLAHALDAKADAHSLAAEAGRIAEPTS